MKISIYGGEAFPIYEVHMSDDDRPNIEIDQETLERWRKVFEEFSKVQQEITQKLREQDKEDYIWYHHHWEGFHL
jgi:hypothetical protein